MAFGLNAGRSSRRCSWCSGGSDVIGGAGRTGESGCDTETRNDEKCSVSYATSEIVVVADRHPRPAVALGERHVASGVAQRLPDLGRARHPRPDRASPNHRPSR